MTECSHITGFPGPDRHHGDVADPEDDRPLSLQWLSEERIARAQQVWSGAYQRSISRGEAVEILINVRRLAETFLKHQTSEGGT